MSHSFGSPTVEGDRTFERLINLSKMRGDGAAEVK